MYISRIAADGREQATEQHLNEVAKLAGAWASKLNAANLARLAALLHDLGKLSHAFVYYLRQQDKRKRGSVVHSTQGAKYICEYVQEKDFFFSLAAEMIAICIAGHHGQLMDGISPDGETPLTSRLNNPEKELYYSEVKHAFHEATTISNDIEQLLTLCRQEIDYFIQRYKEQELNDYLSIPFLIHFLTKYLFSCLVDADRYNAYCFENSFSSAHTSPTQPWPQLAAQLEICLATKNTEEDTPIKQIRRDIAEKCLEAAQRPKGVYQLKAPTGGGKTLSSLRFALAHAQKHNLERIIYIIPYLSVLEQTAEEIRLAIGISSDDTDDTTILEHHSDLLPPDDEEKAKKIHLLTDRWDAPIVITTMVQFLESVYSEKSGKLRKFHHMTNAVLIFDEVQSLPVKCAHLFNGAINFLSSFGGSTILLCTATQPLLSEVKRPIRLSVPPDLLSSSEPAPQAFNRTRIEDSRIPGGYTDDALAEFIIEKQKVNGNCLVILNTKSDVGRVYDAVKARITKQSSPVKLIYLSTMMCPAHRLKAIKNLKTDLCNHIPVICISSQLIEAGVNISFGCVIRAVAGLDSIAQAAGRCNRHGEDPNGRIVYIVNLAEENLSKLPDIKYGRDATQRILDETPIAEILSTETMNYFYKLYFYARRNEMDYLIGTDGSLYDLLSFNKKGEGACANLGVRNLPALRQAFQTAGERFCVIEQKSTGILVPYEEGEELADLFQRAEFMDKKRLLRNMGRYSVSLYSHEIRTLEKERALHILDDGLFFLDKRYYNPDRGVCFSAKMDLLSV